MRLILFTLRFTAISLFLAIMYIVLIKRADAYELFDGPWEGVFWPPGAAILVDIYPDQCAPGQAEALEEAAIFTLNLFSLLDPSREWRYIGHRPGSGWGVWNDGVVSLECYPQSQMVAGLWAQALPIRVDGHIFDGGAVISADSAPWSWKRNTLHELYHAIMAVAHSDVDGSTMQSGAHATELSYQLQETPSRDDLCAVWAKYQSVGESPGFWPLERPIIDDKLNLYIPLAEWAGQQWEFWMLNNGYGQFGVVLAKPLEEC